MVAEVQALLQLETLIPDSLFGSCRKIQAGFQMIA